MNVSINEDLEKEKKIINQVIYDSRDELSELLSDYGSFSKNDPENENGIREQIINNILEYFVKVIYRLNRFSEFKSKIRILTNNKGISKKEIERCDFIIKLSRNSVTIVKNSYTDAKGMYVCRKKKK